MFFVYKNMNPLWEAYTILGEARGRLPIGQIGE